MNLRPYQKQAIEAVCEALRTSAKVGAVLPTGAGKSLIEIELIDRLCDELRFNQCVMVVCHLSDVVDQLHEDYKKIGRYGAQSKRWNLRSKPQLSTKVIFATIQAVTSLGSRSYWTTDPMKKEVVACLVDEAHQIGTDGYDIMIHVLFPWARIIGFSATPFRRNQYSFSQFDTVAYSIDTQSLIKQGYLVPPKLFTLNMESMSAPERYASMIRLWRERERERNLVTVVYLRDLMQAQEMRLVAEEEGIAVDLVSSESKDEYCRALYKRAREGKVEMIVNVKKLETGINIPNIGAVMMPYGTNSVVTYLQRIGRALRPFPGKSEAHVYVFGDAPSIAAGKWAKMQRAALEAIDPLDPIAALEDDLVDLVEDCGPLDRIKWTRDAIDACKLLLAGNNRPLAELISERRFPEKYSKAIAKLAPYIKPANPGAERKPILDEQISVLSGKHRFKPQDLGKLSAGEAASLITALGAYYSRDPFIIQTGPQAGKHMADTPSMYRLKMNDPENRALWVRWVKAGRPKGEDS